MFLIIVFFALGLAAACHRDLPARNDRSALGKDLKEGSLTDPLNGETEPEEAPVGDTSSGDFSTGVAFEGESGEEEKSREYVMSEEVAAAKGEGTAEKGATPVPGKVTEKEKNSEKQPGEEARIDLKGYTVKIAAWWNLDPKSPSNVYYVKAVEREKEVRKKYNVKIKYISVPGQDLKDKIVSSVIAGDPIGDICRCRSGWVLPTLAGMGYIEPAEKYFDISDPLWNPYVLKQAMYKGKVMGVDHGPLSSYACMLYNRSMIQRLGLRDPQELVYRKEWTWAKFEEYVKAIAKDTDNDGKLDIYGTNLVTFQSAVASNGGRIVSDINGRDFFTLNNPEAVEALKWVQYINGLGVAGGTMADFAMGNMGFYWWWNYEWGFKSSMKDKWGILPCPMGPRAKDYAAWWDEVHLMCIPAYSKYPKETAAIWTDLCRWYPGVSGRDQMYEEMLENQYMDKNDIEMAKFISTKFWLDKYFAYPDIVDDMYPWPDNGTGIEAILRGSGTMSIEQWLARKSEMYQSTINRLWKMFE